MSDARDIVNRAMDVFRQQLEDENQDIEDAVRIAIISAMDETYTYLMVRPQ